MCVTLPHACEINVSALALPPYIIMITAQGSRFGLVRQIGDGSLTWLRKAALVASPSEGVRDVRPRAIISAARSADTHLRVQQRLQWNFGHHDSHACTSIYDKPASIASQASSSRSQFTVTVTQHKCAYHTHGPTE